MGSYADVKCQKVTLRLCFESYFIFCQMGNISIIYFFITENLNKMGFGFYRRCHIMRTIPNIMSCLTLH